ncbi:MAG TPA: vWA domain-containing protein, partial [Polyangiaceae bacterium]
MGLIAGFACSAPKEDDDDDSFGTDANGSNGNGSGNNNNGSGGTASGSGGTSSGSGNNNGSGGTNGDSGGASSGNNDVATATSSGNSGSSSSSGTTGGPQIGGDLGEACEGLPFEGGGFEDEACVGTGYEAEAFPVDLVLMVDVSTSMVDNMVDGVTRWELVKNALNEFVTDPDAEEIGMGIDFWSWVDDDSCSIDQYAEPTVAIGPLGDNQDEIVQALDDQRPGGLTPTYPALAGAIQYAKAHAADNPARQAVVVFVTDGYPTKCDPQDIPTIAELAADSWAESPRVPVFVIGIDGVYNLDQIASAGGTREPFLVEGEGSTERLVTALKNITTDTARCEFEIPPSPDPDFLSPDTDRVQVIYTPG